MAGQGGQEGETVTQNTHLLMLVDPEPVQGLTLTGPSKAARCLALGLEGRALGLEGRAAGPLSHFSLALAPLSYIQASVSLSPSTPIRLSSVSQASQRRSDLRDPAPVSDPFWSSRTLGWRFLSFFPGLFMERKATWGLGSLSLFKDENFGN